MNLRERLENEKYIKQNENNLKNENFSSNTNNQNDILKQYDKYKNYSHDELMNEFLRVGTDLKNKGNLDKNKITQIYNLLSPMLNEEQRNNLNDLLKLL